MISNESQGDLRCVPYNLLRWNRGFDSIRQRLFWQKPQVDTYPVDGSEIPGEKTSWGEGSLSHDLQVLAPSKRWWSPEVWTINRISYSCSREQKSRDATTREVEGSRVYPWKMMELEDSFSSWWFQPLWKICASQIGSFPQIGAKIKKHETTTQFSFGARQMFRVYIKHPGSFFKLQCWCPAENDHMFWCSTFSTTVK